MELAGFLARRAAATLLLMIIVSTGAIALGRVAADQVLAEAAFRSASETEKAELRASLGLDRSAGGQVVFWLGRLARLDLGESRTYRRPVIDIVAENAIRTARLAGLAILLGTLIGLPLGVLVGARPRGLLSLVVTPLSIALVSCPPVIGALALLVIAATTGWLSLEPGHVAVPMIALALPLAAKVERLQSQATSEALAAPDRLAAAARGLPPARLLWVHSLRQSLRPVLGVYGVIVGSLFSGAVAVEAVTAWPGLGLLLMHALTSSDLFLVAGCVLVGALFIAIGNLLADAGRALADPRVRLAS